ncbi:MAG: SRPBCC family protein [Pedobacter sp.]|nr:SRPBCC family protein [Pedobacter sp.]
MPRITVQTTINASPEKVWSAWTTPEDVNQWNAASDDWHNPRSRNDLREGGRFSYRMEAKDGSMGFDFEGTYTRVLPGKLIEYVMDDERGVAVSFEAGADGVTVTESFDAENENSAEMQRQGWQAILDRFRAHVEGKK